IFSQPPRTCSQKRRSLRWSASGAWPARQEASSSPSSQAGCWIISQPATTSPPATPFCFPSLAVVILWHLRLTICSLLASNLSTSGRRIDSLPSDLLHVSLVTHH